MSIPSAVDTVVVTEPAAATAQHGYLDWPAIFAGIVVASAISIVLLTFGSAIGLSFVNFHGGTGVSAVWIGIAAASWLLWVEVSSVMCGGYLAGRMRRRIHDATEHESDVRDGAHGLVVWGGTLLIGAVIATSGVGAALSTIGNVAGTATTAAATAAGPAAATAAGKSSFDPMAYFTDTLFRPGPAPATGAASTTQPSSTTLANADAEAGRILANGAVNGGVSDSDKAYLADLVARQTGLTAAEAKTRVDTVLANVDAARKKAANVAETARKTTVLAAFLAAAALLVAAVGGYWAAMAGGNHRDNEVVLETWFRRF